jgi:hypothetical protein
MVSVHSPPVLPVTSPSPSVHSHPLTSFNFLLPAAKRAIDQGTRLAAVIEDAKTGDVFEAPVAQNYKIMKFVQGIIGSK